MKLEKHMAAEHDSTFLCQSGARLGPRMHEVAVVAHVRLNHSCSVFTGVNGLSHSDTHVRE